MAAPGPPQHAGAGPSSTSHADDEAAAAAELDELQMLLRAGDATSHLDFLRHALQDCEAPEELARREMLELASNSGLFAATVTAEFPDISPELCIERGWPAGCFTACECKRRCMIILAMQDGEFFDEQLSNLAYNIPGFGDNAEARVRDPDARACRSRRHHGV